MQPVANNVLLNHAETSSITISLSGATLHFLLLPHSLSRSRPLYPSLFAKLELPYNHLNVLYVIMCAIMLNLQHGVD